MEIRLTAANPADVDTECLVAIALDHGGKQKSEPRLTIRDAVLDSSVADLIASGELTGKAYESLLLHRPQGLKAKRLLLIGAGKAKNFSHVEVRKAAGTALR